MAPDDTIIGVVLTWTGAAAAAVYLRYIAPLATQTFLERRAQFLLYCAAGLLTVRGVYWLHDAPLLAALTFALAALLPLAATLYVEGLLRRHLPFGFKLYVAIGSAVSLVGALSLLLARGWEALAGFAAFMLSVIGYLGYRLYRRDRRELSAAENRLADGVATVTLCTLPLALTDFRNLLADWVPFKLGSLGALLFVYVNVRLASDREDRSAVFRELLDIALKAAVVAVAFVLVFQRLEPRALAGAFAVAAGFILLYTITGRLRSLRLQRRNTSFLHWFTAPDVAPDRSLEQSLRSLPSLQEHLILGEADLGGYDIDALAAKLDAGGGVQRASGLKPEGSAADPHLDGAEQLLHLLESYGMSHVCLLRRTPMKLLLAKLPPLPGGQLAELELRGVQRLARLLG